MSKAATTAALLNRKFSHAYLTYEDEKLMTDLNAMRLYLNERSVGYLQDRKSTANVNWVYDHYGFADGSVLKLTYFNKARKLNGTYHAFWCAKARAYTC